jgi:hypothetical protein
MPASFYLSGSPVPSMYQPDFGQMQVEQVPGKPVHKTAADEIH